MYIEIDDKSGFCFGVVKAITKAEESLAELGKVFSLEISYTIASKSSGSRSSGLKPSHTAIFRSWTDRRC